VLAQTQTTAKSWYNRATSLRAIDEFTVIKGKLSSAMNLDKIHIHMRAKGGGGW